MSMTQLGSSAVEFAWRTLGGELAIFALTLAVALALRTLGGGQKGAKAPGGPPKAALPEKVPGGSDELAGRARRAPAATLDGIVEQMRDQPSLRAAGRTLQTYEEELRPLLLGGGQRLREIARFSKSSPADLYTTLINCAIRVGRYHLVEGLLDDMVGQSVPRPLAFYESAMKQLAGQKQYHLALALYDRLVADGLEASAVSCSCLIGFAAEVGELQRAVEFFDRLAARGTPSIRAYMTVLRVHAKRQDFKASVEVLRGMEDRGVGLDALALNVVLGTGVVADQLDAVAKLIAQAEMRKPPITDVVSYNTLVKGYAQRGNALGATETIRQMKVRGVAPNAITYNTAMDAAVRSGDIAVVWRLLADLQQSGLRPDKFTCSIMVKGLAKAPTAQRVKDALALLQEAESACDQTLKSTLYHAVLDAAARATGPDAGVALQAKAFAQMRAQRVTASPAAQRLMMQALPGVG